MVEKKGLKLGGHQSKLTLAEEEVLHLLTKEFLTVKKISLRRQTSLQSTYKIVKKLKEKGVLNGGLKEVENFRGYFQPRAKKPLKKRPVGSKQIRLHGQEFNIRILFKDYKYREIVKKANNLVVDGNTIRLYKNSVEVYSGLSFYADSVQKATIDSFEYWNRFFVRLENDLKVILVKPRSQNVKLVKQHYSEVNNEFAEECELRNDKIKVFTRDDGKLWFLIDNSFNLHEAECVHSKTAKSDMQNVVEFFNDLREIEGFTPSFVMKGFAHITKNQAVFDANMKSHIKAVQDLGEGVAKFNSKLDELTDIIKKKI